MSEHRTRVGRENAFLTNAVRWWAACSCGWAEIADSRNDAQEKAEAHARPEAAH